jgi:4'-phosphopantetheinyl transferase EntD
MSVSPIELSQSVEPQPATAARAQAAVPRVLRRYAAFEDFESLERELGEDWLSAREQAELAAWRNARRRRAWLLARMLGKQLVADALREPGHARGAEARRIEILSRDAAGQVNRPRIWRDGVEQPWSLSISHSARGALAALACSELVAVGVDVADVETFSDGFVDLWFTPAERAWFHETQSPGIACFIWAAKEALYKACNDGERFAPREIEVLADGRCRYRTTALADCRLQSWTIDSQLAVLAMVRKGAHRVNHSEINHSPTGNPL